MRSLMAIDVIDVCVPVVVVVVVILFSRTYHLVLYHCNLLASLNLKAGLFAWSAKLGMRLESRLNSFPV